MEGAKQMNTVSVLFLSLLGLACGWVFLLGLLHWRPWAKKWYWPWEYVSPYTIRKQEESESICDAIMKFITVFCGIALLFILAVLYDAKAADAYGNCKVWHKFFDVREKHSPGSYTPKHEVMQKLVKSYGRDIKFLKDQLRSNELAGKYEIMCFESWKPKGKIGRMNESI